ncbi:hypothetical protein ACIRBX_06550 [Kitasatospora sp. NPDC096147]
MDYCDECADYCPGHETCEECGSDLCTECQGCDCPGWECPGYATHQLGDF